jgi:Patatin-like phospholipase
VLGLAGCGVLPRNPVPPDLVAEATIPGMPEVRAWAGQRSPAMERDLIASFTQESPEEFPVERDGTVRYAHLAISGGGSNGAFGAGFLKGWTETGRRPVFKIVTGVSTGALMAPFAYVGPPYDEPLRELYTTTESRQVFAPLSILQQLLFGESLADTGPLATLIGRHVDSALMARVAAAHARGRRLYIGTVDLDSQRFVVWNMGLIAASGHVGSLELFRKVMLASASIPIAFPPVFFEVEAGGRRHDEMHVDGGVGARVFLTGGVFRHSIMRERGGLGVAREDFFVIHNGQLGPVPAPTPRSLRGIGMRVVQSAGKSGIIGDLFRIYAVSLRENAGYNWVTIPDGFELVGEEIFDPMVMSQLYELGYRSALKGPDWITSPPGLRD